MYHVYALLIQKFCFAHFLKWFFSVAASSVYGSLATRHQRNITKKHIMISFGLGQIREKMLASNKSNGMEGITSSDDGFGEVACVSAYWAAS